MKLLRAIPVLLVLLLVAVIASATQPSLTLNGYAINGTSGSPIPVGTSTPVIILAPAPPAGTVGNRCNWCINWVEAFDLICQPIPYGKSVAPILPAGTTGYRFKQGSVPSTAQSQTGWGMCADAINADTTLGWECIGTGAVNVYTAEFARCTHKGANP